MLTQGGWLTILVTGVFILPFYLIHSELWQPFINLIRRLRWFLTSIFILYLYLTYTSLGWSGENFVILFEPAVFRIMILAIILLSVNYYLQTTSRDSILASLLIVLRPLSILGVDSRPIALRAVLTMDYAQEIQSRMQAFKTTLTATTSQAASHQTLLEKLNLKIQQVAGTLSSILIEAAQREGQQYEIKLLDPPRPIQYIIPFLIIMFQFMTL